MAFAIWVPTSLWMGRVVSLKRNMELIQSLADKVRHMALCHPLLLAVDGLASYESAFREAFRSKFPRQAGETGHCKMVSWSNIYIVQGAKDRVESLIRKTQGKGVINTSFIERLNVTFRQRISPLARCYVPAI
jgi:hypothetical protein